VTLPESGQGWICGVAGDGIVTIGDPRLKAPTVRVDDPAQVTTLMTQMVDGLRALNGAGLAAPQIGASVRVVVVEIRRTDVFPDRPECPLIQMINPVIVERSAREVLDWEGCFSVPGIMGLVPRAEDVTVAYTTPDGQQVTTEHHAYVARVVQHEIDHLDAAEFVDRMQTMASLTTVQNYLAHHRAPLG
jgi:peptide deformylase